MDVQRGVGSSIPMTMNQEMFKYDIYRNAHLIQNGGRDGNAKCRQDF
jgi:hypothetical protein